MIQCSKVKGIIELYFNKVLILSHSAKKPCIELYSSDAAWSMSHGSFKHKDTIRAKSKVALGDAELISQKEKSQATLRFSSGFVLNAIEKDGRLHLSFEGASASNRLKIRLCAQKGEAIYGLGEQYSALNMKGKRVPLLTEEQGVGRGFDLITLLANLYGGAGGAWYTTYFAQPSFISSNGLVVHSTSTAYSVFDFRKAKSSELTFYEVPKEIIIDSLPSMKEACASLSAYLGRQKALPSWTYNGIWLGVQGGTDEVRRKLNAAEKAHVKVGALWAQDWEGRRITSFGKQLMWNWEFDNSLYPNLPAFIEELMQKNIRFLGYINPFLALEGNLYAEAKAKNYCVKTKDGEDYLVYVTSFPAAMVDLTNPEAFAWIKSVIKKNMIDIGLSGWMADFAEYLPMDAVLYSKESPEIVHNTWPVLWAKANEEAIAEAHKTDDIVFFMRSGFSHSSRHARALWAGDQLVNFSKHDGLASTIPSYLSMGISGIGITHSDIGGYTTVAHVKRSKECLLRWSESAVFTPIMRSHEGNRPDSNHQLWSDSETLTHLARCTKVFSHLKDYHLEAQKTYEQSGIPPMRAMSLMHPNEKTAHDLMHQYYYGDELLVAPCTKKGAKHVRVWIPEDGFIHAENQKLYKKGFVRVEAPLGEFTVFYKEGSKNASLFKKAFEK